MLLITATCIAYILGIIWGLYLTKVGYSPFILLIIAILIYFKRNPQIERKNIIKILTISIFIIIGFFHLRFRLNDFESKYVNKSKIDCCGYIERCISDAEKYNKYLFKNEYNDKFIIYIKNSYKINEDTKLELKGRFIKPSHARNSGRI